MKRLLVIAVALFAWSANAGQFTATQYSGIWWADQLQPATITLDSFDTTTGAYTFSSTRTISAATPISALFHADGAAPVDSVTLRRNSFEQITTAAGTLTIPSGFQGRVSFSHLAEGADSPLVTSALISDGGVVGKKFNPGFYWTADLDNRPSDGSGDIAYLQSLPICDGGDGQEYVRGTFGMLDWGEAEPTKGNDLGIARFIAMLDWFEAGNCASTKFGKKQAVFSIRGRTFAAGENAARRNAAPLEHQNDIPAWQAPGQSTWRGTVPIWNSGNPATVAFNETLVRYAQALANHPRHEGVMGPESAVGGGIEAADPTFDTDTYFAAMRSEMALILSNMPNTIGFTGHNFYGAGSNAVQTARRDLFVTDAIASGNQGWFYPDPFSNPAAFGGPPVTLSLEYLADNPATIPSIAGGQNPGCNRYRDIPEYFTAYAESSWTPAQCALGDCAPRPSHIVVAAHANCSARYTEADVIAEITARVGDNSMTGVCPSSIASCI